MTTWRPTIRRKPRCRVHRGEVVSTVASPSSNEPTARAQRAERYHGREAPLRAFNGCAASRIANDPMALAMSLPWLKAKPEANKCHQLGIKNVDP